MNKASPLIQATSAPDALVSGLQEFKRRVIHRQPSFLPFLFPVDINECDASHGPSGLCGQGAVCTNILGTHHCHCPPGFTGDPFRYCEDVNECDRRFGPTGQCGEGAVCANVLGSFSCSCPPGMTGNAREKCLDINECSIGFGANGKCGFSAVCTNSPGSFSCRCPPGSYGDPFVRCFSEKICLTDGDCLGNSLCKNSKCFCPAPYFGESCKRKLRTRSFVLQQIN